MIVLAYVGVWFAASVALAGLWVLWCEIRRFHCAGMQRLARARFTDEAIAEAQARVDAGLDALPQATVDRIFAAITQATR